MAAILDLKERQQGRDWSLVIELDDATGDTYPSGEQTFYWTLKRHPGQTDSEAAMKVSVTLPEGATDLIVILADSATTGSISPGGYVYDVTRVVNSGVSAPVVQTLIWGSITVVPRITQEV